MSDVSHSKCVPQDDMPPARNVTLSLMERIGGQLSRRVPLWWRSFDLPNGALSVSFDDFPKSAWQMGGAVLAQRGVKATYYTSGGLCGRHAMGLRQFDLDDLQAVYEAEHEIGCHTYGHLSAYRHSAAEYAASIKANKRFLEDRLPGLTMQSFAYPYGHAPLAHRRCASRLYLSCRGVATCADRALNRRTVDPSLLMSVGLWAGQRRKRDISSLIADAAERKGWLILSTHDVHDRPSPYGCTPAELDQAISLAQAAGLDIGPVGTMMLRGTTNHTAKGSALPKSPGRSEAEVRGSSGDSATRRCRVLPGR
ncbi:polysaccharide deacetylase family protein [Craurococcus roseus]|uniref:polysaccharide deacetylase family protein n=1 Tax=Craurococcus roseus TaxID=77585 RepID=UPI0031D93980